MADTELTKQEISQFTIPNDATVCLLECKKAFEALTTREKLYAHHLSRADWYGSLICLLQVIIAQRIHQSAVLFVGHLLDPERYFESAFVLPLLVEMFVSPSSSILGKARVPMVTKLTLLY
jgi:hypothetical protein